MKYWIGPWVWDASEGGGWALPPGCTHSLELRPPNVRDVEGWGVFASPDAVTLTSEWEQVGTGNVAGNNLTVRQKNAFRSALGRVVVGDTLDQALWLAYALDSDLDGVGAVKPLTPNRKRQIEVVFAGQVVRRENFDFTSAASLKCLSRVKRDYREIRERVIAGEYSEDMHRKYLGWLKRKFRVSDESIFIDDGLPQETALDPATTLTDSFTYSNGNLDTVSSSAWLDAPSNAGTADIEVSSNQITGGASRSAQGGAMYNTALSGTDHYSQLKVVALTAPPSARAFQGAHSRAARNGAGNNLSGYNSQITITSASAYHIRSQEWSTSGVPTTHTDISNSFTTGDVVKIQSNGSTHTAFKNGVEVGSSAFTDTTFSSELYCGIVINEANGSPGDTTGDDWEAADLGTTIPQAMYHYQHHGQHL